MVPINYNMDKTEEEDETEFLSPYERESRFGQYDHVRQYGIDYFERLKNVGFEVKRETYEHKIVESYGFQPGEELIICYK